MDFPRSTVELRGIYKKNHASDRLGTPWIGKLSRILVEAECNACLHVTNIGLLSNFQKFYLRARWAMWDFEKKERAKILPDWIAPETIWKENAYYCKGMVGKKVLSFHNILMKCWIFDLKIWNNRIMGLR